MASAATYQKYRRAARYPLFLAGICFIVGFFLIIEHGSDLDVTIGQVMLTASWAIFLADYVISLLLSPNKLDFIKTHPLQAIGVLFPPLRIVLIFHAIVQVIQSSKGAFGQRVRLYLIYVSTLVVFVSSVAVLAVERNAPGATIVSMGDSLWWAAETISTVGYGDMVPVTFLGRVIAVSLMINGIAILSVVTATVSQAFMNSQLDLKPKKAPPKPEPEG